MRSKFSFWQPT